MSVSGDKVSWILEIITVQKSWGFDECKPQWKKPDAINSESLLLGKLLDSLHSASYHNNKDNTFELLLTFDLIELFVRTNVELKQEIDVEHICPTSCVQISNILFQKSKFERS